MVKVLTRVFALQSWGVPLPHSITGILFAMKCLQLIIWGMVFCAVSAWAHEDTSGIELQPPGMVEFQLELSNADAQGNPVTEVANAVVKAEAQIDGAWVASDAHLEKQAGRYGARILFKKDGTYPMRWVIDTLSATNAARAEFDIHITGAPESAPAWKPILPWGGLITALLLSPLAYNMGRSRSRFESAAGLILISAVVSLALFTMSSPKTVARFGPERTEEIAKVNGAYHFRIYSTPLPISGQMGGASAVLLVVAQGALISLAHQMGSRKTARALQE